MCSSSPSKTRYLSSGTYYVALDGFANSQGNYVLTATCPTQNTLPTVTATATCNSVIQGSTALGTTLIGNQAPELWYNFTAPTTGTYTFNSCGSSYDTWLHVAERMSTGAFGSMVATCDDCGRLIPCFCLDPFCMLPSPCSLRGATGRRVHHSCTTAAACATSTRPFHHLSHALVFRCFARACVCVISSPCTLNPILSVIVQARAGSRPSCPCPSQPETTTSSLTGGQTQAVRSTCQ